MKVNTGNKNKKTKRIILAGALIITLCVGVYLGNYWNIIPKKCYTAEDFGIETIKSTVDFNNNGVDDYTDILLGARQDAINKPTYDAKYWAGGYPPDDVGVCTDVIWRAFKNAGYSLRDMIDNDIEKNIERYPIKQGENDSNIDFRRVVNLKVFFGRFAVSLTTDPNEIDEWQGGDIVIFKDSHIAIASDKRNRNGQVYIIHNYGQPKREEDALTHMKITGHYRFDASLINKDLLIAFNDQDQS